MKETEEETLQRCRKLVMLNWPDNDEIYLWDRIAMKYHAERLKVLTLTDEEIKIECDKKYNTTNHIHRSPSDKKVGYIDGFKEAIKILTGL